MRILLVEDDRRSREFLARGLTEEGYIVDPAADGEAGLQQAMERDYDLIILDVMLPRRDGWSVLTALRKSGKTVPVLFLTARDTVPDRVKGLELGADDYLVKPFAWAEFTARIKTLLRRGPARQADVLKLAAGNLDPEGNFRDVVVPGAARPGPGDQQQCRNRRAWRRGQRDADDRCRCTGSQPAALDCRD